MRAHGRAPMRRLSFFPPYVIICSLTVCGAADPVRPSSPRGEVVVLVHGLGRSPRSMRPLERSLRAAGYEVLNWDYPSGAGSIETHGRALGRAVRAAAERPGVGRVHLVGHSLGAILVRWVVAFDPPARLGRAVLLAPPNRGAAAADRWAGLLGGLLPPLRGLTTDETSPARSIPTPAGVEIGVIAGRFDGKVRPEETRLDGAADSVIVPATHTFLPARRDVRALTLRFLETGRFDSAGPRRAASAAGAPPCSSRCSP